MTRETLDSWYTPKVMLSVCCGSPISGSQCLGCGSEAMTVQDIAEIKLDHLQGDADDAEREEDNF